MCCSLISNLDQKCVGEVCSGVVSLSWRPYQVQVCCWPPMLASHVGPPNGSHVRAAGLPSTAAPPSPWRCWCCQPMEDRQGGVVCRGLIYNSKEQEGEPQHSRTESPSNRCLVRVSTLSPSWMDRNKDVLGRGYTPTYDHCCVRTSCIDTGVASQMEWCDTMTLGWHELLCKHLL